MLNSKTERKKIEDAPFNQEEIAILDLLEEHCDQVIAKNYDGVNDVTLSDDLIDKLLSKISILRKKKLWDEWVKRCKDNSWTLREVRDYDYTSYFLQPIR